MFQSVKNKHLKAYLENDDFVLDPGDALLDTISYAYNFVPIGNKDNMFGGVLNGHGNSIKNIYAEHDDLYTIGLFGVIGFNATVERVVLENPIFISNKIITSNDAQSNNSENQVLFYNFI